MESKRLQIVKGHLEPHHVSLNISHQSPPHYQYTLDDFAILSDKDRDFFEENGYFVVRKLIPEEQLQKYKTRFQQICEKELKVPGLTVMKDVAIAKAEQEVGERAITKIQDFFLDPVLMEYCHDAKILEYAEAFIGKDIMAMHTMLINKPPDPGSKSSRHPMHQDLYYFPFRPANRIVAAWTAMQRITRENGCLVVLPGTHKGHLMQHEYPEWEGGVNKMYHGLRGYDPNTPRVHLEMDPGDTVFFHPILIHGSGANVSSNFRKAISCHFASSNCNYIDTTGTVHENISQEVREVAKRRAGKDVEFEYKDLWRMKATLVQGERVNL